MTLTVGQLRKAIADLPDNMPVLAAGEMCASDAQLYISPGTINKYGHVWEGHSTILPDYRPIQVLLVSQWGADDDCVDITPESSLSVVDGELAPLEITAAQEEA